MPDGFSIRLSRDTATPDLVSITKAMRNARPLWKAVGVGIVSITKRAFNESGLRESSWPAKKDGKPATLKDTSTLFRSPRVVNAENKGVVVGSDRPYAAVHQLGGVKRPMPRRPYFPFDAAGRPTDYANRVIKGTIVQYVKVRGRL